MKRYGLIWCWLFTVTLTACHSYFSKSAEMEQALELAKAVYGDGNLEVEVDTVLFIPGLSEAPDYFAEKRQYEKAALAALLNGYTEKDFDKEAAMLSFKEAEQYGELAQDSLTVARAEYWMGRFLHNEGRKEEALSVFKTSFHYVGNWWIDRAAVENSLAVSYMMIHQFDSAEMLLQNSFHDAQTGGSEKMERKALNNLAVLYQLLGDYNKSIDCLRKVLKHNHLNGEESVKVFLTFCNTFMAMKELDSAALYYQRMEDIVSNGQLNCETRVSIYDALLKYGRKQSNDSLVLQYYEKHESALFEVMSQRQEQAVFRIQKQYDYEDRKSVV